MKRLTRIFGITILLISSFALLAQPTYAESDNQTFAAPILVVNTSFLNIRTGPSASFSVLTTVVGGTELPVLGAAGDNVWYQVSTPVGVGWANVEFTLPRGDFTNVPLVTVTTPPAAPVAPNTVIVVPDAPVVTNPSAPAAAPAITQVASNEILFRAVPNQNTNLYTEPNVDSSALAVLFPGDRSEDYPVVGFADGFFAVSVPEFGTGWIEAGKIDLRLARTTTRDVLVAKGDVGLTSGPGGGTGDGLPVITAGTEGYLVAISANSQFIQIQLGDGTLGWGPFEAFEPRTGTTTDETPVSAVAFTAPAGQSGAIVDNTLGQGGGGSDAVVVPAVPVPVPSLAQPVAVVNTSFLNIRSGPGAQYTVLFTARGGSELNVIGLASDGVWFLVQGPFGQGWVNNEFVLFRGDINAVPIISDATGIVTTPIVVIGESVQLYAAPGTNFGVLGSIVGPVEAPIVARTADFEWVQINTSAGFGWVLASQVTVRGDVALIPVVAQ
jgi:uncharacterized protein YgiM (DUF1202 family)